jgi:predicted ester cyclase
MGEKENKDLVRVSFEQIFNEGDLDAVEKYFAADWIDHNPAPGDPPGLEAIRAFYRVIHGGFPDLHCRVELLVAEGDLVASRVSLEGTHLGDYFGEKPTGKRITVTAIGIDRIANGKIVESWNEGSEGFYKKLTGKPLPLPQEVATP